MTFLPIAARELRVASRKRSTFWLRVVAALVGLVIGTGFLIISTLGGVAPWQLGKYLFGTLTWLALTVALSAGVFFTSDCISEEKREGTLGFLFLTDLRGYDVVTGKLLANSLRCFYALLAIFPILAVTFLMGGTSGPQFWKTSLALLSGLFCSLSAGLFVSAISRQSQKAMSATMFLLFLWIGGGPIANGIYREASGGGDIMALIVSSPGWLFVAAGAWGRTPFWTSLGCNLAIAAIFFGLACLLVKRTWQEKSVNANSLAFHPRYAWKYGNSRRRAALRRKLIDRNPVLWLASRERWQALAIWILALLASIIFVVLLAKQASSDDWMGWSTMSGVCGAVLLYVWVASRTSQFFVEARQQGVLELLLATPVTEAEIISGRWRAFLSAFGPPIAVLLILQLASASVSGIQNYIAGHPILNSIMPVGMALSSIVTTTANLVALGWFGMWMGMTSKSNNLAALKTLVFVQVIPWFAIGFVTSVGSVLIGMSGMLASSSSPRAWSTFIATIIPFLIIIVPAILTIGKDIGFIVWARRKLRSSFRGQASRQPGYLTASALTQSPPVPRLRAESQPPVAAKTF